MRVVPRLTIDTSCVIAAVKQEPTAVAIERLIEAAQGGRVELWLAAAFDADQTRASDERLRANLEWLSARPVNHGMPGPFRLNYSELDGPDVLIDGEAQEVLTAIEEIVLTARYQPGSLDEDDQEFMADWQRKMNDPQHLAAHWLAGHDAFVTNDRRDMVRKRDLLMERTGITVVTPEEAVDLAGA